MVLTTCCAKRAGPNPSRVSTRPNPPTHSPPVCLATGTPGSLTYLGLLAIALFAEANPAAMQQGVQRLLLILPGEAAQILGTALSVDATRLPLRQGASHAAAAAGLLDQLAAQRTWGTHGQSFLVAGLTVHERAQALSRPGIGGQQQEDRAEHHFSESRFTSGRGRRARVRRERGQEDAWRFLFFKSLAGRAGALP